MKQLIRALLLLITLILSNSISFASTRWINAESTPDYNTYVDSQTVSYNKNANNIIYWVKRTDHHDSGYTFLEQHSCNLTEKKIDTLKSVTYKKGNFTKIYRYPIYIRYSHYPRFSCRA